MSNDGAVKFTILSKLNALIRPVIGFIPVGSLSKPNLTQTCCHLLNVHAQYFTPM